MAETGASITPNPYEHHCNPGVATKAILDCPGCAYERGVAEGFKAGYQWAQNEAAA